MRLPCFAISCRTANIASAIPLPGIKPNCASLSLLSIILSKIVKVYQLHPSAVPTIVDVSLLYINWYNQSTPLIYSPVRIGPTHCSRLITCQSLLLPNTSTPTLESHPSPLSFLSSFVITLLFTLQYLIPTDSLC